jgi:hypothetical protein
VLQLQARSVTHGPVGAAQRPQRRIATPTFRDAACQTILGLPARGENAWRPDLPAKKPSDPVETIT